MFRIKFPTKCIFWIFYIWTTERMMPFCDLLMEQLIYTVNHKKVEPFYFCNNFVKYQHNWIIFGTRVA